MEFIKSCDYNHPGCQPHDSLYRPTRLLEILDNQTVRVISTSRTETGSYAALSHCWGQMQTIKLQSATREKLENGIEVTSLPKSYQEAILVCLKLSISFLWIDSLCIVQDSKEDWERESVTMRDVYGNSCLNICAAAAANGTEESFLGRSRGILKVPQISTTCKDGSKDTFFLLYDHAFEDINESPLTRRAWVYQEWYLSPRSLILCHNLLWWHCRWKLTNEETRDELTGHDDFQWFKATDVDCPRSIYPAGDIRESFLSWFRHVNAYMQMNLTKESDRTVAFSGIVSSFGLSHKLTGTYLAGLWHAHLPAGLCWYIVNSKTSQSSRYMAPSWTWTSLHGPCKLECLWYPDDDKLLATLESAPDVVPEDCSNLGSVVGCGITLRGDIVGPVSLGASETSTYVANKHTGDEQATVYFDENDDNGPLITNMGSLPFGEGQSGLRQVERLADHTGSFFILPIADVSSEYRVYGLVLYRALHDPMVFSRVGLFESSGISEEERFNFKVTNKSVAGTLVTIV